MALRARDIMQPHVLSAAPAMSLRELGDLLISKRVTGAPVIEAGKLVGIVSRSDFVRCLSLEHSLAELIAEGMEQQEFAPADATASAARPTHDLQELEGRTVRDIMVADPVTVPPDTPITEVARVLVTRHVHRLLVVDHGAVHGVISALDVVRQIAEGRLREP